MRIRTIKPEQPKDEELAALPIHARYLFAFLPTHADREGRLEDRPRVLKLEIFPWDEGVDVNDLLNLLSAHFISRYEINGRKLIQIRNFLKHQRPNIREPRSVLPPPPDDVDVHARTVGNIPARAKTYQDAGKGTGTGTGREGKEVCAPTFSKPTIEDIKTYCLERSNRVDPQKWLDHYTSNGWRVGRNPMKDWRAAVRTWEKNDYENTNGKSSSRVVGAAAPVPGKYDHLD